MAIVLALAPVVLYTFPHPFPLGFASFSHRYHSIAVEPYKRVTNNHIMTICKSIPFKVGYYFNRIHLTKLKLQISLSFYPTEGLITRISYHFNINTIATAWDNSPFLKALRATFGQALYKLSY